MKTILVPQRKQLIGALISSPIFAMKIKYERKDKLSASPRRIKSKIAGSSTEWLLQILFARSLSTGINSRKKTKSVS